MNNKPKDYAKEDFAPFAILFFIVCLVLSGLLTYKILVHADDKFDTERRRQQYLQEFIDKQLADMHCVHTGYGPYKSNYKVYVCDLGTFVRKSDRLERIE